MLEIKTHSMVARLDLHKLRKFFRMNTNMAVIYLCYYYCPEIKHLHIFQYTDPTIEQLMDPDFINETLVAVAAERFLRLKIENVCFL